MECYVEFRDGNATRKIIEELTDLYRDVYSCEPGREDSIHHRQSFIGRTAGQAETPGFQLIAARAADSDQMIGCSFGLPFAAGKWWRGALDNPHELVNIEKFAVIELIVRNEWQGKGIGRSLMNALLSQRPEPYATLLARPDGSARSMYDRWGWQLAGHVRPAEDAPSMDALSLSLDAG